jgi:uncharacterized protein (UPF0262 family)
MSKDIIEEIIEECIDTDLGFSSEDILNEGKHRGSTLTLNTINNIILSHRYPLHYSSSISLINNRVIINIASESNTDFNHESNIDYNIDFNNIQQNYNEFIDTNQECIRYSTTLRIKPNQERIQIPKVILLKTQCNIGDKIYIHIYDTFIKLTKTMIIPNTDTQPILYGYVTVNESSQCRIRMTSIFKLFNYTEKPSKITFNVIDNDTVITFN